MAAITAGVLAATAVAGIGMQAYGMSKQMEASEEAARGAGIQAEGARIQAQGSALQATGSQRQVEGARAQNAAQKEITKLEFKGEEQRFAAMELDAKRKQIEVIRNQQRARALGLTVANAQGARQGSGIQGAYGQISGATTDNLNGIFQNLEIGRNIFGINRGISDQRLAYAAGGDIINEGQGIIAQGSGIIAQGAGVIAQGGGVSSAAQGQMAMGQGLSSLGGSLVQAAPTFGNVAGSLSSAFGKSYVGGWLNQRYV